MAARAGERAGEENGESVVRFFHEIDDLFLLATLGYNMGRCVDLRCE